MIEFGDVVEKIWLKEIMVKWYFLQTMGAYL
jgi:hypothetical protein